ncbi:hypothetical protein V5030_14855 [Moellerella wisconsensis]|uniref:hypothetical protein n=1 Tax=Moellerella wisconsensis TaxID=158849 RepID=UPI0030766582
MLKKIFEAGVFYNAGVMLYPSDIELIDEFINNYYSCLPKIHEDIRLLLFQYFIERNPQVELLLFKSIYCFTDGADIVLAAKDLKMKLILPWPPFYLSKVVREHLQPDILLNAFLQIACKPKGFKSVTEDDVKLVTENFSLLTHFREGNHFFQHRVRMEKNIDDGAIHIYYNRDRVTFRKSLINALENIKYQSGRDILTDKWSAKNISSLGEMLLAQAYSHTKNNHKLSQEAYFKHIIDTYPAIENIGLRDKKSMYGGKKKLDELKGIFAQNFEIKPDEIAFQRRKFGNRKEFGHRSNNNLDVKISPSVLLSGSLSLYIKYYTFILSHADFIKRLYKLRESIKNIVTMQFNLSESHIFYILNVINDSESKPIQAPLIDVIKNVETQCYVELKELRAYPIKQNLWGYFTEKHVIPNIDKIIQSIGELYKICNQDFQYVTHEQLKQLGLNELFEKSVIINHIIQVDSDFILASYSLSDHTVVYPINSPNNIYGSIQSALDLYDESSKNNYLASITTVRDFDKIQSIIWGVCHLYEKTFSCDNVTDVQSIKKIEQFYPHPISESKFKAGKKIAQELIVKWHS